MGGFIGVESVPGEGSTFYFTVPLKPVSHSEAEAARPHLPAARATSGRRLRVLLAEDNQLNQKYTAALLEAAGHRVDAVANGTEAVDAVQKRPYDIVLMDIQMPEMDGLEATRVIRRLPGAVGSIPIIAVTANAMVGDRDICLAARMTDYVSKPFDLAKLNAAIKRCLAGNSQPGDGSHELDSAALI
jgi:CheY-like chemotaxis protein